MEQHETYERYYPDYPFAGFPQWRRNARGELVEVRISPKVSVKPNHSNDQRPISIFVDGREWKQCMWLAVNTTLVEFSEAQEKIAEDNGNIISMDTFIKNYNFKHETPDDISIEEQITAHASSIIGWIENGFDLSVIDSTLSFYLIDVLLGKEESEDRKKRYIADIMLSGHPQILLLIREKFWDVYTKISDSFTDSDHRSIFQGISKWFTILDVKFDQFSDIISVLSQIKKVNNDNWILFAKAILSSDSITADFVRVLLEKLPKVTRSYISTLDQATRNRVAFTILEKSQRWRNEKERNAEYYALTLFNVETSVIERHYKLVFERDFNVDVAIGFLKFIRLSKVSSETTDAFKHYLSVNIDKIRSDNVIYFNKCLADLFNLCPDAIHNLSFSEPFFDVGMEIEQCFNENEDYVEFKAIASNPNPLFLPMHLPSSVKNNFSHSGSYDTFGLWEIRTDKTNKFDNFVNSFLRKIDNYYWVWHNEYSTPFDTRGCSTHLHFSPNDKFKSPESWKYLWDNLIVLLPLTLPFWIFGKKARKDALTKWAIPVTDMFSVDEIASIEAGNVVKGKSGHYYQASHQYDLLAWNLNQKPDLTIEFRLCEQHPVWAIRCVEAINSVIVALLHDGSEAISIKDQESVIKGIYKGLEKKGTYQALKESSKIEFVVKPTFCTKQVYDNALEFFKDFCKSYRTTMVSSDANKVLEMFGKLVDLDNVSAEMLWDIPSLYELVKSGNVDLPTVNF